MRFNLVAILVLALSSPVAASTNVDWDNAWDFSEKPLEPSETRPDEPIRPPGAPATKASSPLKISGVLFDGLRDGEPEQDEAIRITNTDRTHAVPIGGFSLSDRYAPADRDSPRFIAFPEGATVPAGGEIWVALEGDAFRQSFGFPPDYEGRDTRDDVPQMLLRSGEWPTWGALRGVVSLHDAQGEPVDLVPWDRSPLGDLVDKADVPRNLWNGPSVLLFRASPYGWNGQILARDRDEHGALLADTDSAEDWNSSFSATALGRDPIHRVEYPGQSRFVFPHLEAVQAEIIAASAPDNAFSALQSRIDGAKKEVLVRIYQFDNDHIADLLVRAKRRGVNVVVFMEGAPVGGVSEQGRYIAERLKVEGIPVWFLAGDEQRRVRNRYRFDHSKYLLVDGEWVVVATENFGYTGHPVDRSFGNRGWMLHVRSPELYRQLRQVWDDDLDPARHFDLVELGTPRSSPWTLPPTQVPFEPKRQVPRGDYAQRRNALRLKGRMALELVVCPDNCLSEKGAIIGAIAGATKSLDVLQNSIPLWWGPKNGGTVQETPNLPLMAVVEAARRGVRVRVLLDGVWYNTEPYDPRDNDDTVRFLDDLARREGLDLQARVLNLAATGLEKIHAKGIIVDGRRVLVSSTNWTENSFKGNREVGVLVDHPKAAAYYASLFQRDWELSRLYRVRVAREGGEVRAGEQLDSRVLRRAKGGDVLDVMTERGDVLEVRLGPGRTGFLPRRSVAEHLALADEAAALIGRTAQVSGRVREAKAVRSGVYLNFGENWRADFSVFVPAEALEAFREASVTLPSDVEGREIEVTGELVSKDGPLMRVEDPGRLRVVRKP